MATMLARSIGRSGRMDRSRAEELIGESRALELVGAALTRRIADGIRSGRVTDQAAAITRLHSGTSAVRNATIGFELAGSAAVAWTDRDEEDTNPGIAFLMRQAACIGGGTTEMSRNVISERVLGMPRERSMDKDVPFRQVPRSAAST